MYLFCSQHCAGGQPGVPVPGAGGLVPWGAFACAWGLGGACALWSFVGGGGGAGPRGLASALGRVPMHQTLFG